MTVTAEMILAVRREIADTNTVLPILSDEDYEYFLTKNNENIRRASLDAAKSILLNLAIHSSKRQVDVLSVDDTKRAEAYRQALILYLRSPDLNPVYNSLNVYGSGISNQDMINNNNNSDNNFVKNYGINSPSQTSNLDPWNL